MDHPGFWTVSGPFSISEIAANAQAEPGPGVALAARLSAVRPLAEAGPHDLSFFDNRKYLDQLERTRAAAVFLSAKFAGRLPAGTVCLVTPDPYRAFAKALELFYPDAGHPKYAEAGANYSRTANGALIATTAQLEDGVIVEPGAVIGPEAAIGGGTVIGAGAVIGYRVAIGRSCYVGPAATLAHTLVGNRVILHAGVRCGQDGFGFAMGPQGHYKVRQIGRVIIQDDVEIGAGTAIDRGALRDTVIGEGTKIDNLVQIGHNVVIGRHCVIVSQVGIAGSTVLEDFVVIGGQTGVIGHVRIGAGAQIAAASGVSEDVPRGARWGGTPAQPIRQWARQAAMVKRLAKTAKAVHSDGSDQDGT